MLKIGYLLIVIQDPIIVNFVLQFWICRSRTYKFDLALAIVLVVNSNMVLQFLTSSGWQLVFCIKVTFKLGQCEVDLVNNAC